MPIVKIYMRERGSGAHRKAILDGVHDALVSGLRIPDGDRTQMVLVPSGGLELPAGKGGNAIVIEIILFAGRSADAKKRLYSGIIANLGKKPGIKKEDVLVVLNEQPKENWCIRGVAGNEADLGFRTDV